MKRVFEILHGARKIEWLLLLLMALVLLLVLCGDGTEQNGSDLEKRLRETLEKIEGAGKVEVLIALDGEGLPEGVLVVTEGAGDIAVNIRLQQAVHALLGLEVSRIEVVQRAGQRR